MGGKKNNNNKPSLRVQTANGPPSYASATASSNNQQFQTVTYRRNRAPMSNTNTPDTDTSQGNSSSNVPITPGATDSGTQNDPMATLLAKLINQLAVMDSKMDAQAKTIQHLEQVQRQIQSSSGQQSSTTVNAPTPASAVPNQAPAPGPVPARNPTQPGAPNVNVSNNTASMATNQPTSMSANTQAGSTTSANQFNQNKFSLAVTNCSKIKFIEMEKYLSEKKLKDDSATSMEELYATIYRSINYGFSTQLDIIPNFRGLNKTISFETLFLQGLIGSTRDTCKAIFEHIGDVIKSFLRSESTINNDTSPEAFIVVQAHQFIDGWSLLETLLKSRLTICGAKLDNNLDRKRCEMSFQNGETLQEFFVRVQGLQNEYFYNSSNDAFVPVVKIMQHYLDQLCRCQAYYPNLIRFQEQLTVHIETFGIEGNIHPLPFTLSDVYQLLVKMQAPRTPPSLLPDQNVQPAQQNNTYSTKQSYEALISSLESTICADCVTPEICSKVANRHRCQVCLVGFHDEVDCFARGEKFQNPQLRRRIKIYNQIHGDAPPAGHKFREWNPPSIPAIHKDKEKEAHQSISKTAEKKGNQRPFANYSTKSGKKQIQLLETKNDQNQDQDSEVNTDPAMMAFIQDQASYNIDNYDTLAMDSDQGSLCSFCMPVKSPQQSTKEPLSDPCQFTVASKNVEKITDTIPYPMKQLVSQIGKRYQNQPSKHFLRYQANAISKLEPNHFNKYCDITMMIDGGANCGSLRHRELFAFYVETRSGVQQAGGTDIVSQGWGGVLVKLNGSVVLAGPFYHYPNSPRNIWSPNVLKNFCNFKHVIVAANEYVHYVDHNNKSWTQPSTIYNDLDFDTFEICMFSQQYPSISSSMQAPRRSKRLQDLEKAKQKQIVVQAPEEEVVDKQLDEQGQLNKNKKCTIDRDALYIVPNAVYRKQYKYTGGNKVISRECFSQIAAYYVQLHASVSPRQNAIANMNIILGYLPQQSVKTLPLPRTINNLQTNNEEELLPIIANFTRASARNLTHHQHWLLLHSGAMHTSTATLKHIIQKQLLRDIHKSLQERPGYDCTCMICRLSKPTLSARGKLVDKTNLAPFQRIHVDFSFFTVQSIRGFTSGLDVTCSSTSYPFSFPTKSKAPLVDTLQWLINCLKKVGYEINFIRVDEGGELARSASFTKFVCLNDCVMETTGGGNSCNNGMVERGNMTKADMIRAQLSTMNILMGQYLPEGMDIEKFWCFAYQHTSFILRRMYNRNRKEIPYYLVHKERPSVRELVPLGAIMTIVNPNKNHLPKLSRDRAIQGHFLGYSNHTKIRLYWSKDSPNIIKRSSHNVIEDVQTMKLLEGSFISTSNEPNLDDIEHHKIITQEDIDVIQTPFDPKDINKVTLHLPRYPTMLGFMIQNDTVTNLPYLQKSVLNSFAYRSLHRNQRHNQYILSINGIDYLTAQQCLDAIKTIQKSPQRMLSMELTQREIGDSSTSLMIHRAMFDQFPHHFQRRPVIASTLKPVNHASIRNNSQHNVNEREDHFITAATKPQRPASFFEALKSPYRHNWKAAAWIQFQKNKNIAVFSLPFPKEELPENARVFQSQLVPEIKATDVPSVFEFKIRDVIVGTKQIKYLDYDDSYAPIADPCTIKTQLTITCARDYFLGIYDVKNAFQNTIAKPKSRIYTTIPPTYLEWLAKTENFQYNPATKYYRQMLNSNQGTRDAGCLWYCLLRSIVEQYGFVRSTVDHAFFVKLLPNGEYMYASLATDDILCSFHSWAIFDDFKNFFLEFFELSTQTGQVLKFLGIRIIQSDHCITMDQAEYTMEMLKHYFGTDVDKIKTHRTPLQYNKEFERDLRDSLPIQGDQLVKASMQYKGPYRFWTGKLLFLAVQTRFDIGFSVQRLSEYNNAPTIVAFEGIVHILRYLAGDVLCPITYPKTDISGKSSVSWFATPSNEQHLTVPNEPTLFFDAEFAKDVTTRHSYYCNIITVFNVAILYKVKKTTTIMLHTTDAEMKGGSAGVRQLQPIRRLFEFCGLPLGKPSQAYTDNAAVHAIIESGRMTPRCRHIDIPIALMQQEHNRSFRLTLIRTMIMLADMGTKVNTPKYHEFFKKWVSGAAYLPPSHHDHYKLLQMEYYEVNYASIIKSFRSE